MNEYGLFIAIGLAIIIAVVVFIFIIKKIKKETSA